MDKKTQKDLIVTSFLCLGALGVLVLSTIAWFASNKNVASDGMQVNSEVTPNLVIAKTLEKLRNISLVDESCFLISFETGDSKKLIPATHDWDGTETGLKYNSNPRAVSVHTGLERGETGIGFAAVPLEQPEDLKHYYVDYVVYIASKDAPLPTSGLVVNSLEAAIEGASEDPLPAYLQALSVDFYVGDVAAGNYKGTLNLANQKYENDSATESVTSVVLTNQDIPEISEQEDPDASAYIKVTMRVYFDGGLREVKDGKFVDPASTYIRSSQIDTSGLKIKVGFEAPALVQ